MSRESWFDVVGDAPVGLSGQGSPLGIAAGSACLSVV